MEAIQNTSETTVLNLGDLLDAGDDAMVTLVAGQTRLVVHRAVLMDRSPVFATMFAHDTLETSSGHVDIADVEGPVLRLLLTFLYTLRVPQLSDTACPLLVAADKYGVAGLKAACEQQVAAQLSVETAAAAAVLAVRHSCQSLRNAAINFIKANLQVMATQGWADAVCSQPEDVVEVSRLLAEQQAETSTPPPACPTTQPRRRRRRRRCTPASAASHQTTHPDDATVSSLRRLPAEERNRRLIEAAKEGAVGELEALLAAGADVAAADWRDLTALQWAANHGHVEAVRLLVERGAPVNARDSGVLSPLHWAVSCGNAAVVRLLLAASADHSARDIMNGWTALHCAAVLGHAEAAAALLEAGADWAATDDRGRTPLDLAREWNHEKLVELLTKSSTMETIEQAKETTAMELGALLDACDVAVVTLVAGETRLVAHRAVLMDRSPVFAAMFTHDTLESRSGQVNIADVEGPVLRQLLSYLYTLPAPQLPDIDMVTQLLVAADKYGVAGLKAACEQQVAAQLSVETAAAAAMLAVRHSCESLRQASITFLKDNTRQVMATRGWADAMHCQPDDLMEVYRLMVAEFRRLPAEKRGSRLREAAQEGAVGEMEALLAAGADVAAVDGTRWTTLHCAAHCGHEEAARRLVARGAPVDARENQQWTPLHLAAASGHAAVARLLLAASADHRARDHNGWTPLHWAAYRGKAEAAAALLEAGADKAATDNRGRTALDLARERNQQQLVELLAER